MRYFSLPLQRTGIFCYIYIYLIIKSVRLLPVRFVRHYFNDLPFYQVSYYPTLPRISGKNDSLLSFRPLLLSSPPPPPVIRPLPPLLPPSARGSVPRVEDLRSVLAHAPPHPPPARGSVPGVEDLHLVLALTAAPAPMLLPIGHPPAEPSRALRISARSWPSSTLPYGAGRGRRLEGLELCGPPEGVGTPQAVYLLLSWMGEGAASAHWGGDAVHSISPSYSI